jgi:hypothetical protein
LPEVARLDLLVVVGAAVPAPPVVLVLLPVLAVPPVEAPPADADPPEPAAAGEPVLGVEAELAVPADDDCEPAAGEEAPAEPPGPDVVPVVAAEPDEVCPALGPRMLAK